MNAQNKLSGGKMKLTALIKTKGANTDSLYIQQHTKLKAELNVAFTIIGLCKDCFKLTLIKSYNFL